MERKETGALGEKLASEYLKKKGYRIIATNYRCPIGEIDIIAKHQDCLAFIEVRTKNNRSFGPPEESISRTKKKKMRLTAAYYLNRMKKPPEIWRIDFVAVEIGENGKASRLEVYENAVGEE